MRRFLKLLLTLDFLQSVAFGMVLLGIMFVFGILERSYATPNLSFSHLFYVPILFAGFVFGTPGGLFCGLIGGLILGPWTAEDFLFSPTSPTDPWFIRLCFFGLVGGLSGFLTRTFLQEQQRSKKTLTALQQLEKSFKSQSAALVGKVGQIQLCLIRMTNYQQIQELLSPLEEDILSQQIAERLQKTFPLPAMAGALSHALFLVMMGHDLSTPLFRQKIMAVFKKPFEIKGHKIWVKVACGFAVFPDDGKAFDLLLRQAHKALLGETGGQRQQKLHQGGDLYQGKKAVDAGRQRELADYLPHALSHRQFSILYQPTVNLKTGLTENMDCIVEWHHPTLGIVSAAEFMPLLDQVGRPKDYTTWVLETAAQQLKGWRDINKNVTMTLTPPLSMLKKGRYIPFWREILAGYHVTPQRIIFSVSEADVIEDAAHFSDIMKRLKENGFYVTVTGVGASLFYLMDCPVQKIKTDPRLIQSIDTFPRAVALLKSMQMLAHQGTMTQIVSGMETEAQYESMRHLSVGEGDGYYVSLPLTPEEANHWVKLPYPLHPLMKLSTHS